MRIQLEVTRNLLPASIAVILRNVADTIDADAGQPRGRSDRQRLRGDDRTIQYTGEA